MKRSEALQYVGYALDDSLNPHNAAHHNIPDNAVLVGWQCGFEPMFVAVWSYLPRTTLSRDSAIDIACDYLQEIGWFADIGEGKDDPLLNSYPIEPDYVIGGSND